MVIALFVQASKIMSYSFGDNKKGHQSIPVFSYGDLETAVKFYHIEALLIDEVWLPKLDLQRIADKYPHLKMIMLTSSADTEIDVQYIRMGFQGVFIEAFDRECFLTTIKKVIAGYIVAVMTSDEANEFNLFSIINTEIAADVKYFFKPRLSYNTLLEEQIKGVERS